MLEIVEKKISCEDKFGNVVWKFGEGPILVCPMARNTGTNSDVNLLTELMGVSNKKPQIDVMNVDNESQIRIRNINHNDI